MSSDFWLFYLKSVTGGTTVLSVLFYGLYYQINQH